MNSHRLTVYTWPPTWYSRTSKPRRPSFLGAPGQETGTENEEIIMAFENMGAETYVRARAEQLAMQADLAFFQELYLARGINFGSEVGEAARQAFDAWIEPFREMAIKEFTEAHKAATESAKAAFEQTIDKMLGKASLTGKHDAAEVTADELAAFEEIVKD
jgi:hypothetical protein